MKRLPRRGAERRRQHGAGRTQADRKEEFRPEPLIVHDSRKGFQQPDREPALTEKFPALLVNINRKVIHINGGHGHRRAVAKCRKHGKPRPEPG